MIGLLGRGGEARGFEAAGFAVEHEARQDLILGKHRLAVQSELGLGCLALDPDDRRQVEAKDTCFIESYQPV